jgi:predicted nucleotidyltransferase
MLVIIGDKGVIMISTETVEQMAKRIIKNFAPQKVIAFGSWARGETNADSDIDFLIILRKIRQTAVIFNFVS